jgi:hypothetical protein
LICLLTRAIAAACTTDRTTALTDHFVAAASTIVPDSIGGKLSRLIELLRDRAV